MGVLTGIGGHIATGESGSEVAINCVRTWGVAHPAATQALVCSATKGATMRIPGNETWTGQFTTYGVVPPVNPGDLFKFHGAITGVDAAAVGVTGEVMCDSVTIDWDQEGGAPIGITVAFSGNGPLTYGTIVAPGDLAVPAPATSKGCKVELTDGAAVPDWNNSELPEVRTVSLVLTRENQEIYTAAGAGWANRAKGNLDATVDITVYADDATGWSHLPMPNTEQFARLYVNDTKFYLLEAIMFSELGGLDVDIEGGTVVGASISSGFQAYPFYDAQYNEGTIVYPDDTILWPE